MSYLSIADLLNNFGFTTGRESVYEIPSILFSIALHGKKREPVEKMLDGRVEAKLIALRCSDPPAGYQHWTLRRLADQMVVLEYVEHISHESVRQLLKKTR